MLLVKDNIQIISETHNPSTNCEMYLIKLQFNNNIMHILLIYRPPINCPTLICNEFSDIIHTEFNFHYDTDISDYLEFKTLCNKLNLKQHINYPIFTHSYTLELILIIHYSKLLKITREYITSQ